MEGDTHTPGSPHNEPKALIATILPPLLILLSGLVLTMVMANRVEQQAFDQTNALFQAQHTAMINALTGGYRDLKPDSQTFSSRFNSQIPDGVSVRIDSLKTHSKAPAFESSTGHQPKPGSSLRSEVGLAGQTWLISSMPDRIWYQERAIALTKPVWVFGLTLTALGVLVCGAVALRWRRQAINIRKIEQKHKSQSRELRNTQTEKRILRQALEDSEQRSRDLVSLSGGIVCELDENGLAGFVSARMSDMLGFAPADLSGEQVAALIAEPDQQAFADALSSARQDRQMQRLDLTLITANSQPMPATLRVLALHDTLHGFSGYRLSIQART
ncbi:PAS domain-containing protein [Marinobacter sp. CHS3-4]|uniref:PAS domain-containing protein n=1 Tax=Marinobacter sp. CHS3-4 TaxID=3045174 RepID=UPI0024B5710D|nr:PAS domain-containing protein [Marinobacter sp. CHS3-4]MDI9243930.1 PAS domain-containing protein [Marinobacter sp. CHS3-4]